jgi:hypothetical protein
LTLLYPHHPAESSLLLLRPKIISQTLKLCFIPVFTLFLGLLSPPVPSFSGIHKGRKFYLIAVWNAETQHLTHVLLLLNIYAKNLYVLVSNLTSNSRY